MEEVLPDRIMQRIVVGYEAPARTATGHQRGRGVSAAVESAQAVVSVGEPASRVAPSESLRAASRAQESFRDDPFAELSPGPVSVAPLLHPQR